MGRRIRVNGVLYEEVSPSHRSARRTRRHRLNESTYDEANPLVIGLDPLPDGTGPFAYTDSGESYQVECSLGRNPSSSEIVMFLFVDGVGRSRYSLESSTYVSAAFDWESNRGDAMETFEDLCREVSEVDLDDPDSSEDLERVADDFGMETRRKRH